MFSAGFRRRDDPPLIIPFCALSPLSKARGRFVRTAASFDQPCEFVHPQPSRKRCFVHDVQGHLGQVHFRSVWHECAVSEAQRRLTFLQNQIVNRPAQRALLLHLGLVPRSTHRAICQVRSTRDRPIRLSNIRRLPGFASTPSCHFRSNAPNSPSRQ
jgi:hypothetical protein